MLLPLKLRNKRMAQPTGKLKFAYQTIANMECKIEELKAELNKYEWVSVKDSLPENKKGVVATNGERTGEVWFDFDRFNHAYDIEMDEYDIAFLKTITHWIYLPEPSLV
tara:strand:+ start:934 stop:1260 length:327 start_codon:yes stop_codon:yes gene_type:complete